MTDDAEMKVDGETILTESCAWHSPAVLLLSDESTRLEGRFHRVVDKSSVVQLAVTSFGRLGGLADIRLGQYCGVTFVHRDRPYFFLGLLSDNFVEEEESIVEFPLAVVIRAEMRRTYRVPVLDDCVSAEAIGEEEEEAIHRPRVLNISLTGALIEFSEQTDPAFQNYDKLGLTLRYKEIEISLRGVVRRCDIGDGVRRYGVLFPETAGAAEPPAELLAIANHVERLWLGREDQKKSKG